MLGLSDAHRFRKRIAGACMVAAPALLLVGAIMHPDRDESGAAQVAIVRGDTDAWYASHLFVLAGVVLLVPAVLGLMHMLREREVAFGHAGGGLGVLGLMALTGIVAIELVVWQMGAAGADAGQMAALLDRVEESAGIVIPLFVVSLAFPLGLAVLAAGLYRARAVTWWMAAMLVVAALLLGIAGPSYSTALLIAGAAALLVGLGAIGRMVLAESDEAWEHTPEHPGFRPLTGLR